MFERSVAEHPNQIPEHGFQRQEGNIINLENSNVLGLAKGQGEIDPLETPEELTTGSEKAGTKLKNTETLVESNPHSAPGAPSKQHGAHKSTLGTGDTVTVQPGKMRKACVLLTEKYVMIPISLCTITANPVTGSGQKVTNDSSAAQFLVNEEWIDKIATSETPSINGAKH